MMMMTPVSKMKLAVELGCHTRARLTCDKGITHGRKGSELTIRAKRALRVDPAELRPNVTIIASMLACALCGLHTTEQATDFF